MLSEQVRDIAELAGRTRTAAITRLLGLHSPRCPAPLWEGPCDAGCHQTYCHDWPNGPYTSHRRAEGGGLTPASVLLVLSVGKPYAVTYGLCTRHWQERLAAEEAEWESEAERIRRGVVPPARQVYDASVHRQLQVIDARWLAYAYQQATSLFDYFDQLGDLSVYPVEG